MRSDLTYKTIFGNRFMVEELMRWFVADLHGAGELVDALDFSGMVRAHEQSVTSGADGQHGYANDIVWQVPLHARPEADAGEGWQSLVVMLEFQSAVDYRMALRIRNYVDNFHMERWRGEGFGAAARLVPVLPIVLYNGDSRWTAVARVIDLVTPGATPAPGGGGMGATCRASPVYAGDGYVLLDTCRLGPDDLRARQRGGVAGGVGDTGAGDGRRVAECVSQAAGRAGAEGVEGGHACVGVAAGASPVGRGAGRHGGIEPTAGPGRD